jgi:hypothetical protein
MNQKLTATLQSAKKVSKGEYVFSENGKPYRDVKTRWWTAEHKRKIAETLEKVTSNFTTEANPDENRKVVSLRNY